MRVLLALTYYRPHVSGLTIYVQRLAEALAGAGHEVVVLTSRYSRTLDLHEVLGGVRVVRVPVAMRLSKGVIMPSYLAAAARRLRWCHVAVLNLPTTPIEALVLPLLGRLLGRPMAATYHCDVLLPGGLGSRLVTAGVRLTNLAAGAMVHRMVAYTRDYALHSRVLGRFQGKLAVIPPPVAIDEPDPALVAALRQLHAPAGERLIGFVARLASEKGVHVLLDALPAVREAVGEVRVLFAGEHKDVIGEARYRESLQPRLAELGDQWRFLGVLSRTDLAQLYAACDVTALPSLNSTESFGLVQVESMLAGTPVVASGLPGVRVPIQATGMGQVVPPGDSAALAAALIDVLSRPSGFHRPRSEVAREYSTERTVAAYLELFEAMQGSQR